MQQVTRGEAEPSSADLDSWEVDFLVGAMAGVRRTAIRRVDDLRLRAGAWVVVEELHPGLHREIVGGGRTPGVDPHGAAAPVDIEETRSRSDGWREEVVDRRTAERGACNARAVRQLNCLVARAVEDARAARAKRQIG